MYVIFRLSVPLQMALTQILNKMIEHQPLSTLLEDFLIEIQENTKVWVHIQAEEEKEWSKE